MTLELLRLIFISIPGIVSLYVFEELQGKKEKRSWQDIIVIIVASCFNYLIYGAIARIMPNLEFTLLTNIFNPRVEIPWIEIILSSGIGIITAFIFSYFFRFKLINIFGKIIHATKWHGYYDVWDYIFNSPDIVWVYIRDHKLNLTYYGKINENSLKGNIREVYLEDVLVLDNSSGKKLYNTDSLYIAREKNEISVEIPSIKKYNDKIKE